MDTGTFGARLRAAREARGLTRQALADLVGTTQWTIRDYEKRKRPPQWSEFVGGIEHVLGVRLVERDGLADPDDTDPRVSAADEGLLLRALSARVAAADRARAAALPLVGKLARGEASSAAERDRWVRTIEEALTGDTSQRLFSVVGVFDDPTDGTDTGTDGDDPGADGDSVQA